MVSRRWVLFALVVVVLAYGCYLLGQWQFHRLQDREATNAQTRANLRADPAPVGDVLAPAREAEPRDEWRRVTATGTYLGEKSTVIRYQTRDGASGVDIVTPLRTDAGPSLLFRLHLDLACLSVVDFWSDGGASVRLVNETSYLP